jgi:tetratricopeptide (TPR) repeat protein
MARLLAEAGRQAFFQARSSEEVADLCRRAIEMAEHVGALEARVYATLYLAYTIVDITERFELYEELITLCEVNRLWTQASIARDQLGSQSFMHILDLEIANQHLLSALEIDLKIGDVGGLFHSLGHVAEVATAQGRLRTIEDTLAGFLNRSSAPPSRVEKFLDEQRSWLLLPRGEWRQALEYYRQRREELRKGESIQLIVNTNHHLAEACLELNRFVGLADLSEAEAALRENFETGWDPLFLKRYWMVILLSHQERFEKAHELRDEAAESMPQPETVYTKGLILRMDAELARAERRWEEAISLCETLVDILQASGYRWWEARWMIDLGDAFSGRDGPGDQGGG